MKTKTSLTLSEVKDFKLKWCNENELIINIILNEAADYFLPPVIDVGAGMADIARIALPNKEVICIDVNAIKPSNNTLHRNLQIDFFDYFPDKQIGTVFIAHTLQFLDENIERLNNKVSEIDPKNVILVSNENDGLMGELLKMITKYFRFCNPEIKIINFPAGYNLIRSIPFTASLSCDTFETLCDQVSYLMQIQLEQRDRVKLIAFLRSKIVAPEFEINQTLEIYEKQ